MEGILPVNQAQNTPEAFAARRADAAKNEFATLFYREILKEALNDDFLQTADSPYGQMAKEMLIEQLAKDMASKNSSILPNTVRSGNIK